MTTRSRKNLLFTTLSLFSILGYGFFVFAAPPGTGGYNPGETLDPECSPGDLLPNPCIVKLPLTTADNGLTVTGSNVQLGGELLQSTQIKQNGNDFYFTGGKVGVGTSSPQFTLDVGGTSQYSVGVISFSGTLDDLSVDSSNYSATIPITYSLSVATVSAPDEINWNDDQGNTGTFQISGSQILSYGVQVTFANTSGHTGDESWVFTVNKTPSGIMNVSEQVNIGGNFFAAQNQNLSTFIGNGVGNFRDINNAFFAGSSAGFNAINANYSNFIGSGAGYNAMNAYNSNFLGNNAGAYATSAYNSNFIGTNTGNSATDAHDSTFIGGDAGSSSTYAFESVFLGNGTGSSAPNANNSVFIGQRAGQKSVSANTSVFIGQESGANSDNASNSVFLGNLAGQGSFNATHSIFIGDRAGQADVVDNVSLNGWSILIGDSTNTGGFSNSIALGANAVNTASDQFYLTDTITQMSLRGINYTLPVADGNLGDVLTTDSAGGLSWAPAGSSGSGPKWYSENAAAPTTAPVATGIGSIALGDGAGALADGMFVYGLDAGKNATNAAGSNFFGENAGQDAVSASSSNFFGESAGTNATNANYSNFFGDRAGTNSTNANNSNFLGNYAGNGATSASESNFFGTSAGQDAISASDSIFIGRDTGRLAANANKSVFLMYGAGSGATNANNSIFIGEQSGQFAINANNSIFQGTNSGANAANSANSIFIGRNSGDSDTVDNTINPDDFSILLGNNTSTGGFSNSIAIGGSATNTAANQLQIGSTTRPINSIFLGDSKGTASSDGTFFVGVGSGLNATNAFFSNFLGRNAGNGATNAQASNFFGLAAGIGAINATNSNFFGTSAGLSATNANNSNFFGYNAGFQAFDASSSNFFGKNAGENATNASNSIFIGSSAGLNDTVNNTGNANDFSILLGNNTSTGGFSNSIALGAYATNTATNQFMIGSTNRPINSVFIGDSKGTASTNFTFFAGAGAGLNATSASNSIFIGRNAGNTATSASGSVFIGLNAGQNATSASNSIFLGQNAGANATGASSSSFMGRNAGSTATNASQSTFLGNNAGSTATNASQSTFLGNNAGLGSVNASNSIAIGYAAGQDLVLNNTGNVNDYSIMIGNGTGAGGFSNSIALGWQTINTASNQFMIGSTTRPINETRFQGSIIGTQCTITTGTGIACTSDERLKENIIDLTTGTLEKLMNIRTVNYQLNSDSTNKLQIGFLAQNLEQYFPELVDTDRNSGYKSVYYAQMTPILVEAIREMNLNVTDISNMETPNTWRDSLIAWFGNAANGIEQFVAGTIKARTQVCIDDVCVNKQQLQQILQNNGINQSTPIVNTPPPVDPGTNPGTGDSTSVDTGDIPTDPSVPPTDSPLPSGDSSGSDTGSAPTAE